LLGVIPLEQFDGLSSQTGQGREISLKTFFPTEKELRKQLMRQIVEQEGAELRKAALASGMVGLRENALAKIITGDFCTIFGGNSCCICG